MLLLMCQGQACVIAVAIPCDPCVIAVAFGGETVALLGQTLMA